MFGFSTPGTVLRLRGQYRSYYPESNTQMDYADVSLNKGRTVVAVVIGSEGPGEEINETEALTRLAVPGWVDPAEYVDWVEGRRVALTREYGAGNAD